MPPDPVSTGAAEGAAGGVAGVLLAGGRATRMGGGDKSLRRLAGRPILAHVVERVRPQVSVLLLNANGDPARFQGFGLPVEGDVIEDFAGPLAGILTGLEWAGAHGFPITPGLAGHVGFRQDIVRYYAKCLADAGHQITPEHLIVGVNAYVANSREQAVADLRRQ